MKYHESQGLAALRGYTLMPTSHLFWNSKILPPEADRDGSPPGWIEVRSPWYPYSSLRGTEPSKLFDQLAEQWKGNFRYTACRRRWTHALPPTGEHEEWQAILHFPTKNEAMLAKLTFNF